MQVAGVDKPGQEGRSLFGVPSPVAAPGRVRPVGAEGDPQRQQREPNQHGPVGDVAQGFRIRQSRETATAAVGLQQVQHGGSERHGEGAVRQHHRHHMNAENPVRLQGRHEWRDFGRKEGQRDRHHAGGDRQHDRRDRAFPEPTLEGGSEHDHAPAERYRIFPEVPEGRSFDRDGSECDRQREKTKREPEEAPRQGISAAGQR